MSDKKVYISSEEWARIMAEAWLDPNFKVAVETNPAEAINARFPDIQFERIYQVAPREGGVTDDELWAVVKGDEPAFPDI
jgi:hypothetical protein